MKIPGLPYLQHFRVRDETPDVCLKKYNFIITFLLFLTFQNLVIIAYASYKF
jgi:hypothetical protein